MTTITWDVMTFKFLVVFFFFCHGGLLVPLLLLLLTLVLQVHHHQHHLHEVRVSVHLQTQTDSLNGEFGQFVSL